ncbi:LuxR C-terminal-related transcriptional regulator [Saccharopolyspora phatthalungensis]|uniref:Non-specific serine/threonine protein kinase n=1 Tax=Saccharopolyspora phatthalungensis TaxID=664693 RepID=A0A840Q6T7_9PSEU|nr:LuxR C-terminal-related transcriptional regulator [Saccharopolyspora phatthalungensis]MBB5154418.1 non-specific serine/threonine protein kinase [Saccharopolyspora phatthalungensis]
MTTRRVGKLPDDLTSFVGRRGAITQIKRMLAASRLVTLTGVAGVGKSRLATRVARDLRRVFPDGVWLVELARVRPRDELARVLLTSLGIDEPTAASPRKALAEQLADKRLLLLLDGCEHLLDECGPLVSDLLAAAPEVRILATSRAPLAIAAEQVWPVPPMVMPRLDPQGHVVQKATGYEALELFADRASAVLPGFTVNRANEALVVRVCQQLDGLPLAIELAAVWMRSLSVEEILDRLTDRYRLLTLGDRSAVPHHRTLRAAIEWSFDLCSPTEQALWTRLSVFAGSFELDAAEAVCVGDGVAAEDIFVGVSGLVEKSVLFKEDLPDTRTRYRLLKTIQEYGRMRLGGGTKELALRRRHRDYFLLLAEHVDAEWVGPNQVEWLSRLQQDRPNLRAALDFCLTEPGEGHEGLRMAAALRFFWVAGRWLREGRYWLDEALQVAPEPGQQRARALVVDGLVSGVQGDTDTAYLLLAEAQDVARQVGADAVVRLAAYTAGTIELLRNEHRSAAARFAEALRREEMLRHDGVALMSLPSVALLAIFQGDYERAVEVCEQCREICEEHGELWGRAWAEMVLGLARWRLGEFPEALVHLRESVRIKHLFNDRTGILMAIEMEAWIAAAQGRAARAARLSTAVAHLWKPQGGYLFGIERYLEWHAEADLRIRNALSAAELRAARFRGTEDTLDELIRFTLGETPPMASADAPIRLTPREREVAHLVAQGMSNRQIAEQLVISKRTSDSHIEHILAKLGATSRAQIAVWVAEQP